MKATQTKHTSGPWLDIPSQAAPPGYSYTVIHNMLPIADIPDGDNDESNARLIAAAPELLDFAIMATQKFERMFPRLAEHGRSLVAKATGGAS